MQPDVLSVVLRSASFIALFQAAGMAIFIAMFGRTLQTSLAPMQWVAKVSAIAAVAFLLGQYLLEAARMADDMSGMVDSSLQMMVLHSTSSVVLAVRVLGLSVISIMLGRQGDAGIALGVIGAAAVAASFILTGHTVVNTWRWVLAPLLMIHVTLGAFWFGALIPLYLVSRRETPAIAGQVTDAFSRIASWLVPGILAAGLLLAVILVRHLAEFRLAYGISLLGKVAGFAALLGLAALNKWRLAPKIASGDVRALQAFRRCIGVEYVLIAAVLGITAVMTTFFSPEP